MSRWVEWVLIALISLTGLAVGLTVCLLAVVPDFTSVDYENEIHYWPFGWDGYQWHAKPPPSHSLVFRRRAPCVYDTLWHQPV